MSRVEPNTHESKIQKGASASRRKSLWWCNRTCERTSARRSKLICRACWISSKGTLSLQRQKSSWTWRKIRWRKWWGGRKERSLAKRESTCWACERNRRSSDRASREKEGEEKIRRPTQHQNNGLSKQFFPKIHAIWKVKAFTCRWNSWLRRRFGITFRCSWTFLFLWSVGHWVYSQTT